MSEKINVEFPRGIKTVHIPFLASEEVYKALDYQISRINYPKNTRRIEASIKLSYDLKDGAGDYELAQVSVLK